MRRIACIGLYCLMAGTALAAEYRADPANYREVLLRLQAGDRLLLAPGVYGRGLPVHNLSGQSGQAITIEAADPSAPPRFIARPGANTVSLVNVRHITLRHLELDGGNLSVDAIKAEGHSRYADFVTLEHLTIHDHAASQQNVGISTKCPAFGWRVAHNRIERVGTGMYFGDSDGSDAFVGGVIEGNRVMQTLGYNLQIKHQTVRPDDLAGRHDTIVRYNVFDKRDAQPGPAARPNVLFGHWPLTGAGSEDRYLVYGNLFRHNASEALLQAEGRIAIYDNVFINGGGDAIRIQPHNDVPRDIDIFSNTVLASGTGIQVRPAQGMKYRQRVVANVVSAVVPIRGGELASNIEQAYRPEWLEVDVPALTSRLRSSASSRLPKGLVRELSAYPDWQGTAPGAKLAPALQRVLESVP